MIPVIKNNQKEIENSIEIDILSILDNCTESDFFRQLYNSRNHSLFSSPFAVIKSAYTCILSFLFAKFVKNWRRIKPRSNYVTVSIDFKFTTKVQLISVLEN